MPNGKGRKPFTPMDTNPTSIRNMLLGLEMADRVDQSFCQGSLSQDDYRIL